MKSFFSGIFQSTDLPIYLFSIVLYLLHENEIRVSIVLAVFDGFFRTESIHQ